MVRYILIALCFCLSVQGKAQKKPHTFAKVKVNKKSVYEQEPLKATVKVYSSTWFTDDLDMSDLQVKNAFAVPFKRTMGGTEVVNGKQYTTLEFFCLIYPYKAGKTEIPPMKVTTSCPPEGDYKGVPIVVYTNAIPFTVKPVPKEVKKDDWVVAQNITLSESWNTSLKNLKQGDVIERTININAAGTLPSFIPPLEVPEVEGISVYPKSAKVKETKTNTGISGKRIEKVSILLEEEGEVTLPEIQVSWWNPYLQKRYSKTLPSKKLTVKANPDLGMMLSLRDSLNAQIDTSSSSEKAEQEVFLIFGYKPWKVALVAIISVLFLIFLFKRIKRAIYAFRERRKEYKKSEAYWYLKMRMAVRKNPKEFLTITYLWLLKWTDKDQHPSYYTLKKFAGATVDDDGVPFVNTIYTDRIPNASRPKLIKDLKARRKMLLIQKKGSRSKFGLKPLNINE
ncbi:BatD family protein [Sediminitomix flava]|uniref:Oxygen tolerance protein BatD n=1 Tax=Sediminitomix flava TaxID=379075 RepID=A0A316A3F4_SEDFL|nr:BatD family protein [Sediminitomix flava]PWJ44257.1 oxygen tolerance protein BatD [Sediminitomix flava]